MFDAVTFDGDAIGVVGPFKRVGNGVESGSDSGVRGEVDAALGDVRRQLRVSSGNGTEGVRQVDDRLIVRGSSLKGSVDCEIDKLLTAGRQQQRLDNARVVHGYDFGDGG